MTDAPDNGQAKDGLPRDGTSWSDCTSQDPLMGEVVRAKSATVGETPGVFEMSADQKEAPNNESTGCCLWAIPSAVAPCGNCPGSTGLQNRHPLQEMGDRADGQFRGNEEHDGHGARDHGSDAEDMVGTSCFEQFHTGDGGLWNYNHDPFPSGRLPGAEATFPAYVRDDWVSNEPNRDPYDNGQGGRVNTTEYSVFTTFDPVTDISTPIEGYNKAQSPRSPPVCSGNPPIAPQLPAACGSNLRFLYCHASPSTADQTRSPKSDLNDCSSFTNLSRYQSTNTSFQDYLQCPIQEIVEGHDAQVEPPSISSMTLLSSAVTERIVSDDHLHFATHELLYAVHANGIPIDRMFSILMKILKQAYPNQYEQFIANGYSMVNPLTPVRPQVHHEECFRCVEDCGYRELFCDDGSALHFVPRSPHTPEPLVPCTVSVSLSEIESRQPQQPYSDCEMNTLVGRKCDDYEGHRHEEGMGYEKYAEGSAAHAATNTPGHIDVTNVDDRSGKPWNEQEIQAAGRAMQWVLEADPGGWSLDERYQQCARRLLKESGIRRPWAALRSAYNRIIRARTGVDERKRPKPHRLQTSVQKTGARSATVWKVAADAANAGKTADEELKRQKRKSREGVSQTKEQEGKRRRVADKCVDNSAEKISCAAVRKAGSLPYTLESRLLDDSGASILANIASAEGSYSTLPDNQTIKVAEGEALARLLQQEETVCRRRR